MLDFNRSIGGLLQLVCETKAEEGLQVEEI